MIMCCDWYLLCIIDSHVLTDDKDVVAVFDSMIDILEKSSIYQRDVLTSITQPAVRFILFAFSFFIAKVAFPQNH
jgi:hypothetical protein